MDKLMMPSARIAALETEIADLRRQLREQTERAERAEAAIPVHPTSYVEPAAPPPSPEVSENETGGRGSPRLESDLADVRSQLAAAQRQVAEDAKLWEWAAENEVVLNAGYRVSADGRVRCWFARQDRMGLEYTDNVVGIGDSPRAAVLALMEQMEKGKP